MGLVIGWAIGGEPFFRSIDLDIYEDVEYTKAWRKEMRFHKSSEYNESDGCWWLSSDNEGPIEVVIKVQGDKVVASAIADAIEKTINVEEN